MPDPQQPQQPLSIPQLEVTGQQTNVLLSQLITAVGNLTAAVEAAFPQASSAITHTATAGGDTLPANPSGFLSITVSGVAYKLPTYDP